MGYVNEPAEFDEFEAGRLCIPYVTPTGVVGLKFRAIPEGGVPGQPEDSPKYKYRTGFETTIFNTQALLDSEGLVVICEGEIDTMTAHQCGFLATGIAGVNNWKDYFARAYRFRKVAILADNDDAGQGLEFARRVQKDVKRSRIVLMPEGHDVNSFVIEHGEQALIDMVVPKK